MNLKTFNFGKTNTKQGCKKKKKKNYLRSYKIKKETIIKQGGKTYGEMKKNSVLCYEGAE